MCLLTQQAPVDYTRKTQELQAIQSLLANSTDGFCMYLLGIIQKELGFPKEAKEVASSAV